MYQAKSTCAVRVILVVTSLGRAPSVSQSESDLIVTSVDRAPSVSKLSLNPESEYN